MEYKSHDSWGISVFAGSVVEVAICLGVSVIVPLVVVVVGDGFGVYVGEENSVEVGIVEDCVRVGGIVAVLFTCSELHPASTIQNIII